MNIIIKNGNVITENRNSSANNYDWVDYSFDGKDYEYSTSSNDEYEHADGKKDKPAKKDKKTFKTRAKGFSNKVGNAARKVGKAVKNFVGNLKTKKAARKLKKEKNSKGETENKDMIPPVVPAKINGGRDDGFIRANPDGSSTEFKTAEVEKAANGKVYAAEDLKKEGKNTIENGELVKIVPPEAVKELKTTDGETIPFHKDDVIDKDAVDDGKKGLNPETRKWLIGCSIAAGVLIAGFIIYKLAKKK